MNSCSVSIITVNHNEASGLERTIKSVIAQTYHEIEYIIIDGGSTDESVDIIKKYSDHITYWISEADKGIYHAMNKGIMKVTHDYVLFLNSGDEFYSDKSLQQLAGVANGEDFIYGDLVLRENDKEWISHYPSIFTFSYFLTSSLPHPSTLIKHSLFDKIGLYNEQLKIVSDWEFFTKAICKYNATYKHVGKLISVFYVGGISSNAENKKLWEQEIQFVLQKEFTSFLPDYKRHEEVERDLHLLTQSFLVKLLNKSKILKYLTRKDNKKGGFKIARMGLMNYFKNRSDNDAEK